LEDYETADEWIMDLCKPADDHFNEVFDASGEPKDYYKTIFNRFNQMSLSDFEQIINEVKTTFFNQGITFAVYSVDKKPDERIFRFDLFRE